MIASLVIRVIGLGLLILGILCFARIFQVWMTLWERSVWVGLGTFLTLLGGTAVLVPLLEVVLIISVCIGVFSPLCVIAIAGNQAWKIEIIRRHLMRARSAMLKGNQQEADFYLRLANQGRKNLGKLKDLRARLQPMKYLK
jgi:hypothetical protein